MNRTKLKNYAPQARRDFIQAVTDRAALYGLTAKKTEPMTEKGDVVLIAGKPFPKAVGEKRKKLEARIKKVGFEQTMEAMAYTWFNRFVAIRFMEIKGYLDHGFRVLSHPEGHSQPEILEKAQHVTLPGLDAKKVLELKLDGTKEEELYRLLLSAQCNALNKAMPFLFEKIDDETELLLPDNLLHSDSLIRKLVNEIDEEDWQEVEIIGWLYQFYISEKKDEVIGKVVASEDIPAATQLFTPNWIVKYLVQNTLGRQWLATYPQSALRQQMEYYIEPAEQTPEVQEQLKAITPTSLNPEELTLLDPACGSGHILVEAYDLFKAIYQERGYRAKDIPALILQKNLFGLEIDDRAAQLAAFALMMKARADDRRIFDSEAQPNVVAIQQADGGRRQAEEIAYALGADSGSELHTAICHLHAVFENAKTFGSLIQIPPKLAAKLPEIEKRVDDVLKFGDLTHASAHVLKPLLQQARLLARQYDAVVANPPYMGHKGMNSLLKEYGKTHYPSNKSDLFNMFMERGLDLVSKQGHLGLMTPFTWMFISSYETIRETLFSSHTLMSLIQPEYHAFFESAYVPICAFVVQANCLPQFRGTFIDLSAFYGESEQPKKALEAIQNKDCSWRHRASGNDLKKIAGYPVAYWVSNQVREAFSSGTPLGDIAEPRQGMATADNDRFLRRWHEVEIGHIGFSLPSREAALKSQAKWFPYNKGGEFRKWYGNNEYLVNWHNDGEELNAFKPKSVIRNPDYYFRPSITWSFVSSSFFGVRRSDEGFLFDVGGSSVFPPASLMNLLTGFMCSSVAFQFMKVLNPTLNFQVGNVATLPILKDQVDLIRSQVDQLVEKAVRIAREDWDSQETSWGFTGPVMLSGTRRSRVEESFMAVCLHHGTWREEMRQQEEVNNRLFIEAYGLQAELSPEVPDDQITLYRPDREEDIRRLLSYAIGCMMGRYSLDKPGLIYAHSGNQGFDPSQYKTFRADDDGIIPLLETDWGIRDDATNRFVEFVGVAWPKEHLEENLKFISDSLGSNNGEQARETIRRYLATGFYKHHLSMYKKRPIYWLFSSGKQRAFQCLVYLHRYHEGTLARMRTEYVIPLLGKMNARLSQLEGDIPAASSATVRRKLEKERDTVKKQIAELQEFDARLRHYADQRIKLDLDDGVKVNYGKFSDPDYGDILADVKAICGTKDEE